MRRSWRLSLGSGRPLASHSSTTRPAARWCSRYESLMNRDPTRLTFSRIPFSSPKFTERIHFMKFTWKRFQPLGAGVRCKTLGGIENGVSYKTIASNIITLRPLFQTHHVFGGHVLACSLRRQRSLLSDLRIAKCRWDLWRRTVIGDLLLPIENWKRLIKAIIFLS